MQARPGRRHSRLIISTSSIAALALCTAASAMAAGAGYAGTTTSSGTHPTGFSSIVTAKTVSAKGGHVEGKVSGGTVSVSVPRGASNAAFQVAITKGSISTVEKELPSALKHDAVLADFGVEMMRHSSALTASKPLTVTFKDKRVAKGDIVVAYDPKTGKFVKVKAVVKHGEIIVRIKAGETIAILAPDKKSKKR